MDLSSNAQKVEMTFQEIYSNFKMIYLRGGVFACECSSPGRPEEHIGSHGVEVPCGCELPDMGVGN